MIQNLPTVTHPKHKQVCDQNWYDMSVCGGHDTTLFLSSMSMLTQRPASKASSCPNQYQMPLKRKVTKKCCGVSCSLSSTLVRANRKRIKALDSQIREQIPATCWLHHPETEDLVPAPSLPHNSKDLGFYQDAVNKGLNMLLSGERGCFSGDELRH